MKSLVAFSTLLGQSGGLTPRLNYNPAVPPPGKDPAACSGAAPFAGVKAAQDKAVQDKRR